MFQTQITRFQYFTTFILFYLEPDYSWVHNIKVYILIEIQSMLTINSLFVNYKI